MSEPASQEDLSSTLTLDLSDQFVAPSDASKDDISGELAAPSLARQESMRAPTSVERRRNPVALEQSRLPKSFIDPDYWFGDSTTPEGQENRRRAALRYGLPLVGGAAARAIAPEVASPGLAMRGLLKAWEAVKQAGIQYGASHVANTQASKREDKTSPEVDALFAAFGELAGSTIARMGQAGWAKLRGALQATADGQAMMQFLSHYDGTMPLETVTQSRGARTALGIGRRIPFGKPLQTQYDTAVESAGRASEDFMGRFPGGMVDNIADQEIESGLRIIGPGSNIAPETVAKKLTQQVDAFAGKVNTKEWAERWQNLARDAFHTEGIAAKELYQDLDRAVRSAPISTTGMKARLPRLKIPQGVERDSFFNEAADTIAALHGLPDTITLDGAMETQKNLLRSISDIQQHISEVRFSGVDSNPILLQRLESQVLPDLGNSLKEVNTLLEGRLVPLDGLKRIARGILHQHEAGLGIPQSIVEGGAGRLPGLEEAHIAAARAIENLPSHIPINQAQQIASQLGDITRGGEANVGADAADAAERMRRALVGWYQDAQGNPIATKAWNPFTSKGSRIPGAIQQTLSHIDEKAPELYAGAQEKFQQYAQGYNSQLAQWLMTASPDDITTQIVRNARPNDLQAIRQLVGEQGFREIGNNWLAQAAARSRDSATQHLNPKHFLDEISQLSEASELVLFGQEVRLPNGASTIVSKLNGIKDSLRQAWAIEQSVNAASRGDFTLLRDRLAITPGQAEMIGEDWLNKIVASAEHGTTGDINPRTVLEKIKDSHIPPDIEAQMFPNGKLERLRQHFQKADAMRSSLEEIRKGKDASISKLESYRSIVNDPHAWQAVEGDWIQGGLHMKNGMIDGRSLLNYLENNLTPRAKEAFFQNQETYSALKTLGMTTEALQSALGGPHRDFERHAIYFIEHGLIDLALVIGGTMGGKAGQGAAGVYMITVPTLSRALANPTFTRWLAHGMTLPPNAPELPYIAGQLISILGVAEQETVRGTQ